LRPISYSRADGLLRLGRDLLRLGRELHHRSGYLVLEDGSVFRGYSLGSQGSAFGEAVFATSMAGYQELVTDPSYAEQILCFTAPMVGNYGVAESRCESKRPHVRGVVMREARGPAWTDWLSQEGVVALSGVDTRSLTLRLREGGSMRAGIVAGEAPVEQMLAEVLSRPKMDGRALVADVSTADTYVFSDSGDVDIAVVDYGCKRSILRQLAKAEARVTVYPHLVDAATLAGHDGVVLSNGPGDPEPLTREIAVVRDLLGRVPVLGICLGHQLMALATGLRTFKLPFGHRGANHPVLERSTGRVVVTTQNHGFAVAPGDRSQLSHVSLYDGTIEGLTFPELRARSVQFHPEAGPGPHDSRRLLTAFVEEVRYAAA
jgi:carbamoyl-phosphate synthase small subunit